MNKEGNHIDNQGHLSESQLIQYSAGTMNEVEMHQVETHLLSCGFCSEALEGIEFMASGARKPAMDSLHTRFRSRLRNDRHAPGGAYWKWAAVAAIFLISSVALFILLNNNFIPKPGIATQESQQGENLPHMKPEPLVELKKDSTILRDDLMIDNAIAFNRENKASKSNSNKEVETSEVANLFAPALREMERETSAVSVPQEEVLESIVFMEAAETDSKVDANILDSTKMGEKLAGRAMGLEYSRTVRLRQNRLVTGRVLDEAGDPVPGANITIRGSDVGVVSDIEGEYQIPVPDSAASLLISFIGYASEEINIKDTDTALTTTLTPDVRALSEVVVTGYGTQKKQDITGAVASGKADTPPKPVKGRRKFNRYLEESLVTEEAAKTGVKGTLTVSFFVEEDGSLSDFKVIAPLGFGLDEKAIQLIANGPAWVPAYHDENPVRKQVTLLIPVEIEKE